jgi:mannose-6-phosphate isomerase-like protein (cupin superfamily)
MTGFYGNIEKLAVKNEDFRQVIYTGKYAQLVLMSLLPGEQIGFEVHENVDQFFRIEQGEASFVLNNGKEQHLAKNGEAVIVPAGTPHNVINTSKTELVKLYTIYAPPNHPVETVHHTKVEADQAEAAKQHQTLK